MRHTPSPYRQRAELRALLTDAEGMRGDRPRNRRTCPHPHELLLFREFAVLFAQVVVGDVNQSPDEIGYEVLCRRHHRRRMTAATARAAALSPDVLPVEVT